MHCVLVQLSQFKILKMGLLLYLSLVFGVDLVCRVLADARDAQQPHRLRPRGQLLGVLDLLVAPDEPRRREPSRDPRRAPLDHEPRRHGDVAVAADARRRRVAGDQAGRRWARGTTSDSGRRTGRRALVRSRFDCRRLWFYEVGEFFDGDGRRLLLVVACQR